MWAQNKLFLVECGGGARLVDDPTGVEGAFGAEDPLGPRRVRHVIPGAGEDEERHACINQGATV